MSDASRKRELSRSPPGANDRQKVMREGEHHPGLQVTDHISVLDPATMMQAATVQPPPPETTTPTGKHKNASPKTILSPQNIGNIFAMIETLKTPRRIQKENITNDLLYNLIIGQEMRICNLEKDMKSLKKENGDLKAKLENLGDFEQVRGDLTQTRLDLATTSEGVSSLEAFREQCNIRLNNLELPTEHSEDMQQGENTHGTPRTSVQQIKTDLDEHISNMNTYLENIQKENRRRHLECDHQEQYTRRDSILVKGVPYKRGEDTTDIVRRIAYSIGVNISASDISTSHRTGRQVGNSPRPIICRFLRRDTKHHMMANRSQARHIRTDDDNNPVRIYIDESLTHMRSRVCKKLRDDKIPHKVKDGKIHLITDGENPTTLQVLDTATDWENLDWPDRVKIDLGIYPKD